MSDNIGQNNYKPLLKHRRDYTTFNRMTEPIMEYINIVITQIFNNH